MRYWALHGSFDQEPCTEPARSCRRQRRALRRCTRRLRHELAAREAAENAMAEKDLALAEICHELRTPLNAILNWAQVARLSSDIDQDMREALSRIEANAHQQSMLVNDILDLARSDNGTLRLARGPVDLNVVANEAIAMVEHAAEDKEIRIKSAIAPEPARVLGDAMRLRQIAWNLLTNAVKFTGARGRIDVEVETDPDTVVLRVTDTGRGFSPLFRPRIFDRFAQDRSASAPHPGGSGLGLAIVHRLVELHEGRVEAESLGEGRGATFTVLLPRRDPDPPTFSERAASMHATACV